MKRVAMFVVLLAAVACAQEQRMQEVSVGVQGRRGRWRPGG